MSKFAAIFYGVNNPKQAAAAVNYAKVNSILDNTEIWYVDNGSSFENWPQEAINAADHSYLYHKNVGGNAVFHRWMPSKDNWFDEDIPDYIGFFHIDLYIRECAWDEKVVRVFEQYPEVVLQGFVGSNEIDGNGGRGGGTMLNYLGDYYPNLGQGSKAEVHGRRTASVEYAAVLDHCSMIFRSNWLMELKDQETYYAPEHFYDRIMCCETLKKGGKIVVNGISCDHFNGGIAGGVPQASELCREWLDARGVTYPKDGERTITYVESEKLFFSEYRNTGFIPLCVDTNGNVSKRK